MAKKIKCPRKLPRKDTGVPFHSNKKAQEFVKKCLKPRGYGGKIVKSGIRYKGRSPTYFVYKI